MKQAFMFDDNYLGRLTSTMLACSGQVRKAGLPLSLRDKSKVGGMPGKRISDHQVQKYKQHRNQFIQTASAAKDGISERNARRIEQASSLPSQRPQRNRRTREDPQAKETGRFGAQRRCRRAKPLNAEALLTRL